MDPQLKSLLSVSADHQILTPGPEPTPRPAARNILKAEAALEDLLGRGYFAVLMNMTIDLFTVFLLTFSLSFIF